MKLFYHQAVRDFCPSTSAPSGYGDQSPTTDLPVTNPELDLKKEYPGRVFSVIKKDFTECQYKVKDPPESSLLTVKKDETFLLVPQPEQKWIYVERLNHFPVSHAQCAVDENVRFQAISNSIPKAKNSSCKEDSASGNLDLTKICDCPILNENECLVQRGYVPLDCLDIVVVNHKHIHFAEKEHNRSGLHDNDTESENDADKILQQLRDQCQELEDQLKKTKYELRSVLSENETLNKRCLKLSKFYEEALAELEKLNKCSYKKCNKAVAHPRDDKLDLSQKSRRSNETDDKNADDGNSILTSCTICSKNMRLDELETHSCSCSMDMVFPLPTPTLPDVLVSTVTRFKLDSSVERCSSFKVVTKTSIETFKNKSFHVQRTVEDFLWFRATLQECCPERIVPPLTIQESDSSTLRDVQRFLRRLCSHKVLKYHDWTKIFLSETNKNFEKKKQEYDKKALKRSISVPIKPPSDDSEDGESLLIRTQVYISNLIKNIENLILYLRDGINNILSGCKREVFNAISEGEINDTYLKEVTRVLYRVEQEIVKNEADNEELILIENLESLLKYVKCTEKLLSRVDGTINRFLYWEAQMEHFEQATESHGIGDGTFETSVTQKWAEASANCIAAKLNLESICKDLSSELYDFDLRKEQEMKEILLEYSEGRYEYFEKLQSKWYGAKLMLESQIVPEKRALKFY